MLVTVIFAQRKGATGANGGGAGGGGPCGPRFCTRRSRGGFGLRTRRTLRPAASALTARSSAQMRLRIATWGLRATRTRENAAVERRPARAPRPWGARRHTRCLRAVKARHGAANFRTERLPALCPPLRGGRKKKRPRCASRPQGLDRTGGAFAL